jgi:glycine/D-amino acid oxidase-like deaminating enzyme
MQARDRQQYDVIVVGAGIIGLSSAYHIKKENPDLSVLLVERAPASGQGDTAKSFAALRDCFTSEINRLLARSSIEFYKHMQSELGFNVNLQLIGYLWLYGEREFGFFETIEKQMRQQGVRLRVWEPEELVQLIPDLVLNPSSEQSRLMDLPTIRKGVQGLNCGSISPELLVGFYEHGFRRLGGELLFRTDVKSLKIASRKPLGIPGEPHLWQEKVFTGVETGLGFISADEIIIAAGTRTPFLLDPLGIDCFIKPKKRQIFQMRGDEVLQRLLVTKGFNEHGVIPLTILPKGGIHFRPVAGEGSFWVAAADDIRRPFVFEEEPAAEESYYNYDIHPVLSEYFPSFANQRPVNSWAGLYDINSLDGMPIVERIGNCVMVCGLSGSGIMKADAVGRVAAAVFEEREQATLFGDLTIDTSRLGLRKRAAEKEMMLL